jgi:hypothetical protein
LYAAPTNAPRQVVDVRLASGGLRLEYKTAAALKVGRGST